MRFFLFFTIVDNNIWIICFITNRNANSFLIITIIFSIIDIFPYFSSIFFIEQIAKLCKNIELSNKQVCKS